MACNVCTIPLPFQRCDLFLRNQYSAIWSNIIGAGLDPMVHCHHHVGFVTDYTKWENFCCRLFLYDRGGFLPFKLQSVGLPLVICHAALFHHIPSYVQCLGRFDLLAVSGHITFYNKRLKERGEI
jgi:hypothetical protein